MCYISNKFDRSIRVDFFVTKLLRRQYSPSDSTKTKMGYQECRTGNWPDLVWNSKLPIKIFFFFFPLHLIKNLKLLILTRNQNLQLD